MQQDIAKLLYRGCIADATFIKNVMFNRMNMTFFKPEHICSLLVNIKASTGKNILFERYICYDKNIILSKG